MLPNLADFRVSLDFTDNLVRALRAISARHELSLLMEQITRDLGFRYYALIHHTDLRQSSPATIDIKDYPSAITEWLVQESQYLRDPMMRSCLFADGAFLWSDIGDIIQLDRRDLRSFVKGAAEELNEGITVPYAHHGERLGSCTFAGTKRPDRAERFLGMAQMIGIFAFQAARRVVATPRSLMGPARLHPRPRDCVVLAGRGCSNKEIARALRITPRTVDGYLTEARRLFSVRDRTELMVRAALAGEVGLHELRCQPE